jgi:hypothetical protein
MRNGIGRLGIGVALLAAPALAAGGDATGPRGKAEAAQVAAARPDAEELRAEFLARLGELFAAFLGEEGGTTDARGTIVPDAETEARGTIVPDDGTGG